MGSTSVVDAARRALGMVGVFLPVPTTSAPPADLQRAAVRRLELAGYRAAWANEGIGFKDALVQLAVLLAATERLVFGTGVADIWARQPQTAHAASALLAEAYTGRFVLDLGVGYASSKCSLSSHRRCADSGSTAYGTTSDEGASSEPKAMGAGFSSRGEMSLSFR
jgi:Luciferase-like monooxygenase